jgi:hypothetical protein
MNKQMVLKPCTDAFGGIIDTLQEAGDRIVLLGIIESLLSCAQNQTCDCYMVCSERAITAYGRAGEAPIPSDQG